MRSLSVVVDTTERCNLRCRMCHFSATDRLRFPPFDRSLDKHGNMPLEVFERIADDLFSRASDVALACATEPLIHPGFGGILAVAGRHRVPRLWFPTNLQALTPALAQAIVAARVTTLAVSVDGVQPSTYEGIRAGARWQRLLDKLEMLRAARQRRRSRLPRLRLIFTWMRSNRDELAELPGLASSWGAQELDVRYVSPTLGVDVAGELLEDEDPVTLRSMLRATAEDAVRRGLRLVSYPEFEGTDDRPLGLTTRVRRRLWRIRARLERAEHWRHLWRERRAGCAFPGRTLVIRPNGAVLPCIFWRGDPIGFYPEDDLASITAGAPLGAIRQGLVTGRPVGTCAACEQRRDVMYRLR